MPINILMPALSPTMEKGNLAKWLKKEGDTVKSGDVIAEIETDKATMEVEAVDEGMLAKIVVPEGTADVPVNELIARDRRRGRGPEERQRAARRRAPPAPAKADAPQPQQPRRGGAEPQPARGRAGCRAGAGSAAAQAAEAERRPGRAARVVRLAARQAHRQGSRASTSPRSRAPARMAASSSATSRRRSPAARAKARRRPRPRRLRLPPRRSPPPRRLARCRTTQVKALFEPGSYEEVPHDDMRKTIARRLRRGQADDPAFLPHLDCELDALLALREQINAAAPKDKDGKPAYKLSVNDFVIKALALALQRVPDANVVLDRGRAC